MTLHFDDGDDRARTLEWLTQCVAEGVTAIIVHPDNYAIEVVAVARSMGLDIPGDLSVVAYDDEVASLADVPLTAVAPPKLELGRIGAMMCFERLSVREQDAEVPVRHLTLRPSLVQRASTARLIE